MGRILMATSGSSTTLVSDLLNFYPGPYRLAYLLVTPPEGFEPMKYEIDGVEADTIHGFFDHFRTFLESDARHHIWVHAERSGGTIICDEHDWIYAYGNLSAIEQSLIKKGFINDLPTIPFPHLHNESSSNDSAMRELLGHFDWTAHPVSNLG